MAKSKPSNTRKRIPPQKNPPKPKPKPNLIKYFGVVIVAVGLVLFGYWLGAQGLHRSKHPRHSSTNTTISGLEVIKRDMSALDFMKYGLQEDAKSNDLPDPATYKARQTGATGHNAIHVKTGKKPKLVIIIDDISRKHQIDAIKALPYHITPSIFPPSELSSHSNQLTKYVKHYMIHLPLESGSAAMNKMKGMLFVRDSAAKVQARVDELRRLFPLGKFVNNHTGSRFTAHYKAMSQLYRMLRDKGFVFVDSRTTAHSTVRQIAQKHADTYIARDVFIDNIQNKAAILKQLKLAVKIARKRGYAIAIGHPHKATMDALHHAGQILSDVKTVYIDELYR